MKRTITNLSLLLILIFTANLRMDAQTTDWQPIYLTAGGGNLIEGLEASFKSTSCNESDVIYIKFINHNAYPVKLEWFDAVFTQELIWIKKDQVSDKRLLTIPANSKLEGNCSNNTHPELSVNVKNFVSDKKSFKRYSTNNLTVTAVQ
ncbi:MAG: hypothetical protein Q7W13_07235 [Bacteroidia bacterium]|nr:hypothetical protein [Bacteroidia bacterium]